jgi:hypothetical protein
MSDIRLGLHDFNTIPADTNGTGPHDSWKPIHLSGIPDTSAVQPTLGCNLIYPGLRHVFSGPQESAKTLAAYAIGLDTIRANPDHYLILLDFEMGPRAAKRRWRDVGATDTELANDILYLAPDQPATLDRILILVALNPILVIIDAAAGAFDNEDLDDNKRSDAEKWRKLYVDPFFDNGIATIVLDHVVKNTENRGKYTIGSERKTGGGEVHIGFDTIKPIRRGSSGIYKMTLHKDREGHHPRGHFMDMHVNSDPATHTLTCEFKPTEQLEPGQTLIPTIYMERVSTYLHEHGESSRTHLERNVEGSTDWIRKAIDHLSRLGYVTETRGPRDARIYTQTKVFTVRDWENDPSNTTPPDPASTPPQAESVRPRLPASPPTGERGYEAGVGQAQNGTTPPTDPEVIALLAHYDLLEDPDQPPGDLHD